MRILIVNDDGVDASGLSVLAAAAARLGAEVTVVAPEREQSARSHAITIRRPVFVHERAAVAGAARRIAVSGTPCDCVRLAVMKLLDHRPDLVLSGINHGANLGWDVFFSGTVSAAAEAHSFGIPAVAFSLCTWTETTWAGVGDLCFELLTRLLAADHGRDDYLYNVNIPALPREQIGGVRVTRQEPTVKGDNFEERAAPDGRRYFWPTWEERRRHDRPEDPSYDSVCVADGFISLTPLRYEVHDLDAPAIASAFEGFSGGAG